MMSVTISYDHLLAGLDNKEGHFRRCRYSTHQSPANEILRACVRARVCDNEQVQPVEHCRRRYQPSPARISKITTHQL